MDKLISDNVESIKSRLRNQKITETKREFLAIAFFDLAGSTSLKFEKGHTLGTEASLKFSLLCRDIVKEYEGSVIKYLGDGVLCRFVDPVNACKAALNIKVLSQSLGLRSSAGITAGAVSIYSDELGIEDVLGSTVDRATRVQSFALPSQILVDRSLLDGVETYLRDYPEVVFGSSTEISLKGIGSTDLTEVSIRSLGLADGVMLPFKVHEEGKLSVAEKANFFRGAKKTFDVVGMGNTTFLNYLTGLKPSEFRNHIRNLLASSVEVSIYCLDPEFSPAMEELDASGEKNYSSDIARSVERFAVEREGFEREGFPGRFQVYTYSKHPLYHCFAVDLEEPTTAQFLVSNYLYGITRPSSPVIQFSKRSNPHLFESYHSSFTELKANSRVLPY